MFMNSMFMNMEYNSMFMNMELISNSELEINSISINSIHEHSISINSIHEHGGVLIQFMNMDNSVDLLVNSSDALHQLWLLLQARHLLRR
jgi:hypothetical protein